MHLHCRPFRWPCKGVEAIHVASPNAACPGLHRKPLALDAAIRQLLAPYCPGGHQGDGKQNIDEKFTHFAGCFDGHDGVPVRYRAHGCVLKATKRCHWASTCSDDGINQTCLPLIWGVHVISKSLKKGSSRPNNNRGMRHQSDEKHLNYI